jgi:protein-histidine pros-kinase
MLTVSATFGGLLLAVNVVLYALVLRPLRRTARIADELSRGVAGAAEFPASGGRGEIAALARSFNRMRTSLDKALRLLES